MKEIYERYRGLMIADALKRLRDIHLAEDCAQETFIILFEKLSKGAVFESEAGLIKYLFKVNANVAGHIARSFNIEARATEEYMDRTAADDESIEEEVTNLLLGEELDEALRSIPIHHAVAAVLRYGYDLSFDETAKSIGNSREAARKYSVRGLKELREKLKEQGD